MSDSAETSKPRILIVGGGVGGLATLIALQSLEKFDVHLVEKAPENRALAGMNLAMPPNGARALRELGVDLKRTLHGGHKLSRYELRGKNGKLISAANLKSLWVDEEAPYFSVPRAKFLSHLLDHCGGDAEFDARASELKISSSGVHLKLESNGEERKELFDFVIAADGIFSNVRDELRPDLAATPVGQFSWRTTIEWPDPKTTPQEQVVYSSSGRTFLLIPQGANRVYVYAAIVSDALKEAELSPKRGALSRIEHFCLLFSEFSGQVPQTLAEISRQCSDDDIFAAPLYEADSRGWLIEERVLLIGDAAHASSPSMAQGASLALEDALVLRELLQGLGTGEKISDCLAGFEQRRRARTHHVMMQSRARDAILKKKAASPVLSLIVDQVVRFKGMQRLMEDGFRTLVDERP